MKNRFYLGNTSHPPLDTYQIPDILSPNNSVLVDIGSCRGDFMDAYRDKFQECFAFEASYENASFINKRIVEENWENCVVFNLAVCGKSKEFIDLLSSDSGDAGSNSVLGGSTHRNTKQRAYTIDFNDIFEFLNVDKIDLLKMDCEGCEYLSLFDARLENVKIICMELHHWENFVDQKEKLKNHILKTHDIFSGGSSKGHENITFILKESK